MVCVLHGISIGLAIDMSTCCDVRICAADARFAVKEVDIGLAADIGTLSRLPKCVGNFSWVKDVCLSARNFGAQEALSVGFVSQVHENKAKAVEAGVRWAEFIASKSPVAVQGTKELLNHARDHDVQESMFHALIAPTILGSVANRDYHRSSLYGHLELGHAPIERRLSGAAVWHPEEEADVREFIDQSHNDASEDLLGLYSRIPCTVFSAPDRALKGYCNRREIGHFQYCKGDEPAALCALVWSGPIYAFLPAVVDHPALPCPLSSISCESCHENSTKYCTRSSFSWDWARQRPCRQEHLLRYSTCLARLPARAHCNAWP